MSKPGTPVGESSPWWVAALAWIVGTAMVLGGFAYFIYLLDSFADQSGRIAIEQQEQQR